MSSPRISARPALAAAYRIRALRFARAAAAARRTSAPIQPRAQILSAPDFLCGLCYLLFKMPLIPNSHLALPSAIRHSFLFPSFRESISLFPAASFPFSLLQCLSLLPLVDRRVLCEHPSLVSICGHTRVLSQGVLTEHPTGYNWTCVWQSGQPFPPEKYLVPREPRY